jgi:ribosomal protein S18 acetylase RimI-like enzyme
LLVTSTDPTVADSVRLALPGEAGSIADVQRRTWAAQLSAEIAAAMLGEMTLGEMEDVWREAITRPLQAEFRVLVATQQHRVVGFATTRPSSDPDAKPGRDGEIEELWVDTLAQRRGHGSRLLHACVDTLRADGFTRATHWVASTDDITRRFLTEAGWGPDGGFREVASEDDSVRLKQIRLHTDITAPD